MAIIINTNFKVNAPDPIDDRLIVDSVDGVSDSLVSLDTGYNYSNMYVWVRSEKAFYYLKDVVATPSSPGANVSDWARLISGSGSFSGSASAIDITEVAFGTGTGITSSRNFTFATSSTTLIFGSGSTIASSSRLSSIIGGCTNTIGTASLNSGIFGGRSNNIGTSSQSVIIGGQCNILSGTLSHSSIVGGQCNTLSGTSSQSSIVGGYKNTLSCCSCNSSIIGGQSNKLYLNSCQSSIVGGCGNTLSATSSFSSIIGGRGNTLCNKSCNSSIISGEYSCLQLSNNSTILGGRFSKISNSKYSSIIGGSGTSSKSNYIYGGQNNLVTGGVYFGTTINYNNSVINSKSSIILGGWCHVLGSKSAGEIESSGILGSTCGKMISSSGKCVAAGAILFSQQSCIEAINSNVFRSSIVSGICNTIKDGTQNSVIIGGQVNSTYGVCNSSIVGGNGNKLFSSLGKLGSHVIIGSLDSTIATSSYSSIISSCNSTIYNSTSSVIIGGTGLSLNNECNVVYVPKLKIQNVSNVNASKILVLDDADNLVKYRDVSSLGGGSGSISIKLNAGLTNSGTTYATIYNTTVSESTCVPGQLKDAAPPPTIGHPLTWLRGLTAGYFSQKNIVEVLDMILFPAIPFTYTAPTLTISNPFPNPLVLVNTTAICAPFLLTYGVGVTTTTASEYSWQCSVNSPSAFNIIGVCATSSVSVLRPLASTCFPISTPTTYCMRGTVSHSSSTIGYDTAGNPTPIPGSNLAGCKISNCVGFSSIFPYYFGTVSRFCETILPIDITKGTRCTCQTANNLTVSFNSTAEEKGFLATPKPNTGTLIGSQTVVTFGNWTDQTSCLSEAIPTPLGLFQTISTVPGVTVCGISQTYSVYLFSQGSATTAAFKFTT